MRDIVQLLAAAAVVLGVGWIAYGLAFQSSGAPTLSIDTMRGTVRVEGPEGSETATIGATLATDARVRTIGEGSQVVLALNILPQPAVQGSSLGKRRHSPASSRSAPVTMPPASTVRTWSRLPNDRQADGRRTH